MIDTRFLLVCALLVAYLVAGLYLRSIEDHLGLVAPSPSQALLDSAR